MQDQLKAFLPRVSGYSLAICLTFYASIGASAPNLCRNLFDPLTGRATLQELAGASFLHRRNPEIFRSKSVSAQADWLEKNHGTILKAPDTRIAAWLKFLENGYADRSVHPEIIERVKTSYLHKYVVHAADVPESFFKLQARILREQGHGELHITDEKKAELARTAVNDQKESLLEWLDYFFSADSKMYPMWVKYWAFQGAVKLSKFDPETGTFANRSTSQVGTYPELNREAFAVVVDAVIKMVNKDSLSDIQDSTFLTMLGGANFGKLYGRALHQLRTTKHNLTITSGRWVTYKKGSEPHELVNSLKGMNTGWCTAGESTARHQLEGGDFHVYYSRDSQGQPRIPRLAIRMDNQKIGEVRGIAKDQNMDADIVKTEILEKKLLSFGDEGVAYKKKSHDMKLLTGIEVKSNQGIALSPGELRFLYEIDEPIVGFGYREDPRVAEIIRHRENKHRDIADIFGLAESEVSLNAKEAVRGGIKLHFGNLDLSDLKSPVGLHLPERTTGDLLLWGLTTVKGLDLSKVEIAGTLILYVESASGLTLRDTMTGSLHLPFVKSAGGLKLPSHIGGDLYLQRLEDSEGLIMPTFIGGAVHLESLAGWKEARP
jgi:hypothetical protein